MLPLSLVSATHARAFGGMVAAAFLADQRDVNVPLMRILAFCLFSALVSAPANAADADRELISSCWTRFVLTPLARMAMTN